MKQTVSLTDNYRKRLKDEIVDHPEDGLRGEVEIQVKDKETGEIVSTQRKNLIVYGGREWLLRKAFAHAAITNDQAKLEKLQHSEILWFGIGSGGGEPGNPLQCGTTYGSDKDLYNPVRLRYEFEAQGQSNPNYASRIINGTAVGGYYKKISYIGIKEDLANPYKVNGIVKYPNLIAEVRLEISTDDCCGQTYLEKDYEKSYADINEAALFIADCRDSDPGNPDVTKLTKMNTDYYNYDPTNKRYYYKSMNVIPTYVKKYDTAGNLEYHWVKADGTTTTSKPFVNNSVQYFDLYHKKQVANKSESNYEKDGKYYWITKITKDDIPFLMGIYAQNSDDKDCYGYVKLLKSSNKISIRFTREKAQSGKSYPVYEKEVEYVLPTGLTVTTLDDLEFLSHGTIFVSCDKYNHFDTSKQISVFCTYKNSYLSDYVDLYPESATIFTSDVENYTFLFADGFVFDKDYNLIKSDETAPFNNFSIIRVTQQTDVCVEVGITEIVIDENSTECRCYCSNTDIKKVTEGLKMYTVKLEGVHNYISEDNPATITEVYDATLDTTTTTTTSKSFFVIDRKNLISEKYETTNLTAKMYTDKIDSPYTMFNRVTFSTIRLSHSRECLLVWRIYF